MVEIWFLRDHERSEERNIAYRVEAMACDAALGFARASRMAEQGGGVITFRPGVSGTPEQPGAAAGRHVVARLSQSEAAQLRAEAGVNAAAGFYTWTDLPADEAESLLAQTPSARRADR